MKNIVLIFGLAAGVLFGLFAGCGKSASESGASTGLTNQEAGTAPSAPATSQAAEKMQAPAMETKTAAEENVTAPQPAAAAQAQAQSLIDKAQGLVSEKKYSDALNTIKQLSSFKLTADQQKEVDNLKAKIQELMANSSVSNAVGNLLK
jgi:hypothetical protein